MPTVIITKYHWAEAQVATGDPQGQPRDGIEVLTVPVVMDFDAHPATLEAPRICVGSGHKVPELRPEGGDVLHSGEHRHFALAEYKLDEANGVANTLEATFEPGNGTHPWVELAVDDGGEGGTGLAVAHVGVNMGVKRPSDSWHVAIHGLELPAD